MERFPMLRGFALGILMFCLMGVGGTIPISGLPIATPNGADLVLANHGGVTSAESLSSMSTVFTDLISAQTIGGVKTFSAPPVMSGASITGGSIPGTAIGSFSAGSVAYTAIGNLPTANSPVCTNGSSNITTSCSSILYSIIDIGLGFAPSTVQTSTIYPYQQVPNYQTGTITKIRVACGAADGGTTVFHVYDNGSDITGSPYTLAAATTSTFTLGTPFTLTTGHILHIAVTTAGTGSSCGFTAEGQQAVQ